MKRRISSTDPELISLVEIVDESQKKDETEKDDKPSGSDFV